MKHYFEGWYYKQQTEHEAVSFIPAHHTDSLGHHSASIQIISKDGSFHIPYDINQFFTEQCTSKIIVGKNRFSHSGIKINIDRNGISAHGEVQYTNLTPLQYDIMGPFRYLPFMECKHSVFSMSHLVNGEITLNGKTMVFRNASGYTEGDRGCSFPKHYVWTQCNFQNGSLMLSVADIPFWGTHFTGVIGVVLINGRQYRIATYLGAKATQIKPNKIKVTQMDFTLTVQRLSQSDSLLKAPVDGSMTRLIHESQACRVRFRFFIGKTPLLDIVSDLASFEYEYPEPAV